jgi:hypothetical protein
LQKARAGGTPRVVTLRIELSKITVAMAFDVSFAKEPGVEGEGGFFVRFATTADVLRGDAMCSLVEFQSATVPGVVQIALAAESASASAALDRQLCLRLLIQRLLLGELQYGPEWRRRVKIPGVMMTDAKLLRDRLSAMGKIPEECQTVIDLFVARGLVEAGAVTLRWVLTAHVLADVLAKAMKPGGVFQKFTDEQCRALVQTAENQEWGQRRLHLRQGQRQRRKERKLLHL